MKELAIDPREIEKIVISHYHWDHTGGYRISLRQIELPSMFLYHAGVWIGQKRLLR